MGKAAADSKTVLQIADRWSCSAQQHASGPERVDWLDDIPIYHTMIPHC